MGALQGVAEDASRAVGLKFYVDGGVAAFGEGDGF